MYGTPAPAFYLRRQRSWSIKRAADIDQAGFRTLTNSAIIAAVLHLENTGFEGQLKQPINQRCLLSAMIGRPAKVVADLDQAAIRSGTLTMQQAMHSGFPDRTRIE
jgi:hypothetical protein